MELQHGVLVEAALRGDRRTLHTGCAAALAGGQAVADVVVDVLAPIQQDVGRRWVSGASTVADEHRATAAVDSVLAALELALPAPTRTAPVVCVCAEGEWHAVASRMLALVLASHGWPVVFLGPSLPAGDLGAAARQMDAAAVAITTSTVAALPGASRCVRAVGDAGLPVLVGGQAFRAVPAAAQALGAPSFEDARSAARGIDQLGPPDGPVGLGDQEVLALDAAEPVLVAEAAGVLGARNGVDPSLRPLLHETVRYVVGFTRAAVLLHDRSVLSSHLGWLDTFTRTRGLEVGAGDLVDAVGAAGDHVLDDPGLLHAVLTPW